MLAENSRDLIFRYRILPDPGFEFVSPASVAITGYTPDEFYAEPELINCLIDASSRDLWMAAVCVRVMSRRPVDLELVRRDGSKIWVNQSPAACLTRTGKSSEWTASLVTSVTAKQRSCGSSTRSLHDPLTDLPNRVLVVDRIEHGLSLASRGNGSVALLFVDLDRFKVFNDTRGHSFGDAVLKPSPTDCKSARGSRTP